MVLLRHRRATDTTAPAHTARDRGPLMRLRLALPVAAVAGLALNLAYQPTGWWPMAFVGVGLSLATLIGRSVGAALLVGVVFGAVFYGLHLAWVGQFLGGPIPRLALSGLEALLTAAGAVPIVLAYRWTARGGTHRAAAQLILVPLLIGGIWVSREVVIGAWPYNGFPWARLGMTQVDGPFREVASWTGVTGLSFLIAAVAAGLLQWARAGGWRFGRGALPAATILTVLLIVPQFPPTTDTGTFTVGWVQGNGPAGYFDQKNPGDVLAAQRTVSERISGARMDLLVWPEGSVDSDAFATPGTAATLTQVATSVGAPTSRQRGNHPRRPHLQHVLPLGPGRHEPSTPRQGESGAFRGSMCQTAGSTSGSSRTLSDSSSANTPPRAAMRRSSTCAACPSASRSASTSSSTA